MDLRAFVESIAMPSLALILHSEPGNFLLADGTVVNEMITRLLSWLRASGTDHVSPGPSPVGSCCAATVSR